MAQKQIKLALIDSHALIHRAFHALPPMSTRAGMPTNAVYGFTTMLLKLLTVIKPTHVVAAFDMKGPTFRHKAFAGYKANRTKAPDELVVQFDVVRDLVRAFNIPILEKKGFEADDIIGTLSKGFTLGKKVIVTGDMDTLQLVDETTSVFTLKRGVTDTITYTPEMVQEKYGFPPALVPDYKGLRGDPSDNIPGVAGVGDKTAKELVSKYGTMENIYAHIDELPPRIQVKLKEQKDIALQSKDLATIRCDVPLEFDVTAAKLDDYDVAEVEALFQKLEFKTFLNKLPKSARGGEQLTLGGVKNAPKELPPMPDNYHLVETAKDKKALLKELLKQPVIAFDTETDRLGPRAHAIVGMSFACPELGRRAGDGVVHAYYVPVDRETAKEWQGLLESPNVKKVGHNIKYDVEVVAQSGIALSPIAFDSMLASYLLHPDGHQHNMDYLANAELNHRTIPITDLIGSGKQQRGMSEVPLKDIAHYAAEDADVTWQLYQKFAPQITQEGMDRIFNELELPLISVLAAMELTGVEVDTKQLKVLEKKVASRILTIRKKIHMQAGEEFNVNSTLQLRKILYEKLNLPTVHIARTQSGFSTAAAELAKLRTAHPIIELLEEYRELTKLQSTYITTLPLLVDPKTKRIYASFNQAVAATGRISGSDPNLQNIPMRTELGQEIRAAFVASKGHTLVKADYSQIELRLAAHISQDPKMLAAFRAGEDIHRATAAWVYGITPDEVTDAQRRRAKTLNFGVLYGMGPKKFAQTSGISFEEARSFIERYKTQYGGLAKLSEETIAQAELTGYVETLLGRRRYVPELKAKSMALRAQAERIAFNTPIQGSAADILKKAMIALQVVITSQFPDVKMVLTVHDELVAEVPDKQVKAFAPVMKKTMEGIFTLDVPLIVDIAAGKNWRDVEKI